MIVYTAIYGGYDTLKPHPDHPAVDRWVCFTDSAPDAPGWEVRCQPMPCLHPRLAAKWWKCHPPTHCKSLWVDGSVELVGGGLIDHVLEALADEPLAMWRHPWRDCIYAEAEASVPMPKYAGLPLREQVDHYRAQGWPEHAGLWASTVIGWRNDPTAMQLGAAWFAHCETFTYQDQLSLPPLLERYGLTPAPLPGRFLDRSVVRWHGHASDR